MVLTIEDYIRMKDTFMQVFRDWDPASPIPIPHGIVLDSNIDYDAEYVAVLHSRAAGHHG